MAKVKEWLRARYGEVGGRIVPLEAAREALERGGFPTRMVGDELQFEVEVESDRTDGVDQDGQT